MRSKRSPENSENRRNGRSSKRSGRSPYTASTTTAATISTASTIAASAAAPNQLTCTSHGSAAKKITRIAITSYSRSITTVPMISIAGVELRWLSTSTRAASPARAGRIEL